MNKITADTNCLFCKIVNGEIPSSKFYENENFIAILDLFPNTKGQTIVMPKQHVTSNMFNADFELVHLGLDACKNVAKIISDKLNPSRVALVTEGVFVDHLHFKLYPIYNEVNFLNNEKAQSEGSEGVNADVPVYFEEFPGYITTKGGPQASREVLDLLVKSINDR